eukprot:2018851-Lingulodinium_polyedra.AAC.1
MLRLQSSHLGHNGLSLGYGSPPRPVQQIEPLCQCELSPHRNCLGEEETSHLLWDGWGVAIWGTLPQLGKDV